ncbi:MAG: flavin reductase [Deltaproteobacteria bacterium]|nr:flavin reductase [Deltaproteobacteria bacterium]
MYDNVLKALVSGVYVITVEDQGRINGMTAIWISQVSLDPPLIGVGISPMRLTHGMILSSKKFTVNVLTEGQEQLARDFGFKTGHSENKFEGINYSLSSNGCPVLPDIHSYFNCKLVRTHNVGDHSLLIAEVDDAIIINENKSKLIFDPEDFF